MKRYHWAWLSAHPEKSLAWLKAALAMGFEVHHLDENHDNDAPENLVLLERRDHRRLHGQLNHKPMREGRFRELGKMGGSARMVKLTKRERAAIARKAAKARWAREDEKLSSLPRRTQAEVKKARKKHRIAARRHRSHRAETNRVLQPSHSTVSATSANEDRAAEQARGEAGRT